MTKSRLFSNSSSSETRNNEPNSPHPLHARTASPGLRYNSISLTIIQNHSQNVNIMLATSSKHVNYCWDDATPPSSTRSAARLPLQPPRLRPAHHQHRRRQHLGQAAEKRSAHRRSGRGALGQRLRRRPAHLHAGELLVALHGQAARPAAASTPRCAERGPEDAGRRRDGRACTRTAPSTSTRAPSSIDTPLHAFVPHKHVDHMHPNAVIAVAAAADSRATDARDLRRRGGLDAWQRPGFDLGLKLRADLQASIRRPRASSWASTA